MENSLVYDVDYIRGLIAKCKWVWAKTYTDIPHEYIARQRCPLIESDFLYFVKCQRAFGIHERWGKYNFPYLYVDGYKYWTMGDTLPNTIIINRQKVFDEFRNLEYPYKRYYSENESQIISQSIMTMFGSSVFEIGVGNGDFIKDSGVAPNRYYGIDPNPFAIDSISREYPKFKQRLSCKPFEESRKMWLPYSGVVIALFGTASYLMGQYLKILKENHRDYFLMFFKPGFSPIGLENTHFNEYSLEGIQQSFVGGYVKEFSNYIIASSKEINLDTNRYDLFAI